MEYSTRKTIRIKNDSTLYAINPHMHFRGKYMNFVAQHKGGKMQPLLSVPNYNFNWQRTYVFKEPIKVKAGSRIHIRNAWDNSDLNPHTDLLRQTGIEWSYKRDPRLTDLGVGGLRNADDPSTRLRGWRATADYCAEVVRAQEQPVFLIANRYQTAAALEYSECEALTVVAAPLPGRTNQCAPEQEDRRYAPESVQRRHR